MIRLLARCFSAAISIAYWKGREGNSFAAMIHHEARVRVMAMFPRRPKLGRSGNEVFGKINEELFKFAGQAAALGVPTIAGFPVTSSLWEMSDAAPVLWLSLDIENQRDMEFAVELPTRQLRTVATSGRAAVPLSDQDVLSLVHTTHHMEWCQAIDAIDELRRSSIAARRGGHLFRDAGYKPIYFLIPEPSR